MVVKGSPKWLLKIVKKDIPMLVSIFLAYLVRPF